MKIVYFGRFKNNPYTNLIEKQISDALKKLGHSVAEFDVVEADGKELVKKANESDLFLFHNGGVEGGDELSLFMGVAGLTNLLKQIKAIKVLWYLDRVFGPGEPFVEKMLPEVDYGFFNDDTWVRRHTWENAYCLHLGTTNRELGKYRKDLACDIAFIGQVYGGREEVIAAIKKKYGKRFRIFGDIWGKDFDDLCQSAKVIFQPKWLMNDFCWTDQIYHVLSVGGFLLHPRLYGLQEEGLEDGTHFVGYTINEEIVAALDFFVKSENDEKRKIVVKQGRDWVVSRYTWDIRLATMLDTIKENLIKKQK